MSASMSVWARRALWYCKPTSRPACQFGTYGTASAAMKAIQIEKAGGPEVLKLVDNQKPRVDPGSLLVKNEFIGVNFIDTYHR